MRYFVKRYSIKLDSSIVVDDHETREGAERAAEWYADRDTNLDHWYYVDDKEED